MIDGRRGASEGTSDGGHGLEQQSILPEDANERVARSEADRMVLLLSE